MGEWVLRQKRVSGIVDVNRQLRVSKSRQSDRRK